MVNANVTVASSLPVDLEHTIHHSVLDLSLPLLILPILNIVGIIQGRLISVILMGHMEILYILYTNSIFITYLLLEFIYIVHTTINNLAVNTLYV